jgi:hypothetical protein
MMTLERTCWPVAGQFHANEVVSVQMTDVSAKKTKDNSMCASRTSLLANRRQTKREEAGFRKNPLFRQK